MNSFHESPSGWTLLEDRMMYHPIEEQGWADETNTWKEGASAKGSISSWRSEVKDGGPGWLSGMWIRSAEAYGSGTNERDRRKASSLLSIGQGFWKRAEPQTQNHLNPCPGKTVWWQRCKSQQHHFKFQDNGLATTLQRGRVRRQGMMGRSFIWEWQEMDYEPRLAKVMGITVSPQLRSQAVKLTGSIWRMRRGRTFWGIIWGDAMQFWKLLCYLDMKFLELLHEKKKWITLLSRYRPWSSKIVGCAMRVWMEGRPNMHRSGFILM